MEATTPPAEILVILELQDIRKRQHADDAANQSARLKRHRSNQQLLSNASARWAPEHENSTSAALSLASPSSPSLEPSELDTGGVSSSIGGSVEAGNVHGLVSTDQRLSTHKRDYLPLSVLRENPRHGDLDAPAHTTGVVRYPELNPATETFSSTAGQPSDHAPSQHVLLIQRSSQRTQSLSPSLASPTCDGTCTRPHVPVPGACRGRELPSPPEGDVGSRSTENSNASLSEPLALDQGRGVEETPGAPLLSTEEDESPSPENFRARRVVCDPELGGYIPNHFSDGELPSDSSSEDEESDAEGSDAADADIQALDAEDSAEDVVSDADTEDYEFEELFDGDANDTARRLAVEYSPDPDIRNSAGDAQRTIEVDHDTINNDDAEADNNDAGHEDSLISESSDDAESDTASDIVQNLNVLDLDAVSDAEGLGSRLEVGGLPAALYPDQQSTSPSSDEDESADEQQDYDEEIEQEDDDETEYYPDLHGSDEEEVLGEPSSMISSPISSTSNALGRRCLTPTERELVKATREIGACTIHRMPCQRLKIADVVLYRSGGLNLTRRWKGLEMRDVPDRLDSLPITIEVSQNLCSKPLVMRVVRFRPRDGDITARYWTDSLTFKKKELAIYCLDNIYDTAEEVRQYTIDNALPAFLHTIKSEPESEMVIRTYLTAMDRYMTLHQLQRTGSKLSRDDEKEVEILGTLLILWCAIQHTVGSLYIDGTETLGMLPETEDESYPLYGKVSVPRMVVAQFDNLNYHGVLERYKEKLLKDVDWLFSQDKSRWWFTIYLVVFILLREASRMTADRYRHARANYGPKLRYSIPDFVESLHESCNNILAHWHYYNCNTWPGSPSANDRRAAHFVHLAPEHTHLVRMTRKEQEVKNRLSGWRQYKKNNGNVDMIAPRQQDSELPRYTGGQDKFDWDHPLYWVAQMFEKDWYSHPTYQREPVPKMLLTAAVAAAG
ncbi:hypothetical protein F66182_9189 [Fusarium sp. NRRL 66182]|nr:hypothetical protein F66182_9189 [Fusarium sp. NRRL 66182]